MICVFRTCMPHCGLKPDLAPHQATPTTPLPASPAPPAVAPHREGRIESKGSASSAEAQNPELDGLEGELQELAQHGQADSFLLYLLGLVLADR